MKIGLLHSRLRADERAIESALEDLGQEVERIDVRNLQFDLGEAPEPLSDIDLALLRPPSASRARYVAKYCKLYDIPVINEPEVVQVCSDKVATSITLADAGIPTPATKVALTQESALKAVESFGYPCVIKPVTGSWGRLMAKIDTKAAAEAVIEHKATLGHYEHNIYYIQEFVEKPGRDIRVVAADGEPIAGMYRSGDHWITNAARGAEVSALEITPEIEDLVARASAAVGGGLLGVDLMETNDGYTVHEINDGVEFRAIDSVVDVDVPAEIADWIVNTVPKRERIEA